MMNKSYKIKIITIITFVSFFLNCKPIPSDSAMTNSTIPKTSENVNSQYELEHLYFNEEDTKITREEFQDQLDYSFNLFNTIKYDSIIISKLYPRQRFGRLDETKLSRIQSQMMKATATEINFESDLCIGFFYNRSWADDDCINFYLTDKNFNNLIKENYIRVIDKEIETSKNQFRYIIDKDNFFRSTFFREDITCDNWLAIRPNGDYRTYYGEGGYSICKEFDKVWDDDYINSYFEELKN